MPQSKHKMQCAPAQGMILLAILFVLAGCTNSTVFGAQGGSHGASGGVRWSVPVK